MSMWRDDLRAEDIPLSVPLQSSRGHAKSTNFFGMACIASYLPQSLREIVEPYIPLYEEHAPLIGIALASLIAVYVGYLYVQCQKEAAVAFNVPVPQEVRKSNTGKKWDEVSGQQKQVLEDQVRGVSFNCLVYHWIHGEANNGHVT